MNSKTSLVARQYRLQQWADDVRECQNRASGISVKEWCSQHDISVANYYYRLREVRKACLESVPEEIIPQSIVPVSSEFFKTEEPVVSTVDISIGDIYIHVTEETSPELLKMVFQVACDVK